MVRRFTAVVSIFAFLFLGGCGGSKPANYFILHSMQNPVSGVETADTSRDSAIGIGPVKIPDYLDRPQMATRSTLSSLQFAEFDKWAEPLDKNLARVLAENLSFLLSTDRVFVFPWAKSMQVEYQITVDVSRLDNTPDSKIALVALWCILTDEGEKLLMTKRSTISVPVGSPGYQGIASAESRAVEALSREIATAVQSLPHQIVQPVGPEKEPAPD